MAAVELSKTTISKNISFLPPLLKSKKATQGVGLFITWVAFLLRVNQLAGQSLWRDEVDAIRFSGWPIGQLLQGLFRAGHNGPLYFLLLRPWRQLGGDSEFALRYPSAAFGTLAIPLGFVLARQFGFNRRVGLLLGLLLATSPYLIWYGQEAKMYTLLLALIMLAFITYLKALAGARFSRFPALTWVWWVIFVTATTFSFYTHILSPLILLVYTVVAMLYPDQWRRQRRPWLVSMACLTLPYLPLAVWQIPLLWGGFQSGHPYYGLRDMTSLLLQLYSYGLITFAGLMPMVLFIFLLLGGLFLRQRIHQPNRLVLLAWLLLPPLAVYLISWRVQIFEDRYLIYITPAFYLLTALGLHLINSQARWLGGLCLGLILLNNATGIWQQQSQPLKADFRSAATYLTTHRLSTTPIMIQTPYLHYTLDYYYSEEYPFLEGLWTNGGKTEEAVDEEMTNLTAGLTELWLVVSEEDLWDERHLTRAWLDSHTNRVAERHFVRISIYRYRFR